MKILDQAVILAGGRGTRLQRPDPSVTLDPESEAIVSLGYKALTPIGDRAFLDYNIARLMEAGIRRVCVIVGPDSAPLQRFVDGLSDRFAGLQAVWAVQPEALGTAHALQFAADATGNSDFVMMNSDNLYPQQTLNELCHAPGGAAYAVGFDQEALINQSNFSAERVSSLGILVPRRDNPHELAGVVEKPADPAAYRVEGKLWVNMNLWRFTPAIYEFCRSVQESSRGEFELTLAVQNMSDAGIPVRMLHSVEGVLDLTSRSDIIRLREILC